MISVSNVSMRYGAKILFEEVGVQFQPGRSRNHACRDPATDQRGVGKPHLPVFTFKAFIDSTYLPIYRGKWKASTAMNEELRIKVHLVGSLGSQLMTKIDRECLQALLNKKAKVLARGGVNHLRFRLRSIFSLAVSEGVVERNPAVSLFTPSDASRAARSSC